MKDLLNKFLSKDNVMVIVACACILIPIWLVISNNIYSTKLEVSQLRNEVLQQKIELTKYSDDHDQEVLNKLDEKYEKILQKLDHLQSKN